MEKKCQQIEKKLLHYAGKAIADYEMINVNDKLLIALSGGKDSFTLLNILHLLQIHSRQKFQLFVLIVDQSFPGQAFDKLLSWLNDKNFAHEIIKRDIYGVLQKKVPFESSFYCPLCSRLRRGVIYRYAKEHGFNKIAFGHHRDDLIVSLLMFIFYNGAIRSMPPKFLTTDRQLIGIRPLAYCQEKDIALYARLSAFPLVTLPICQVRGNPMRKRIADLIADLARQNPKVSSNMLRALQNVSPSQLMDRKLWNFKKFCLQKIN